MKTPNLNRYRNVEFVQFMKQVVETVNKRDVDTLLLTAPVTELSELLTNLQNAYKQTLGSAITSEIKDLDHKRDKALRGFKMTINAFSASDNIIEAAKANTLLKLISKHGKEIYHKSYNEQTGIIDTIIKDVETSDELLESLTVLNALGWFEKLKQVNLDFNAKYLERNEESVDKRRVDFLELRKTTTNSFRDLIEYLQAHLKLTQNAIYASLLDYISNLSESYNFVVENRYTSSNTSDTDVDTDTDSDDIPSTDDTNPTNDLSTTTDTNQTDSTLFQETAMVSDDHLDNTKETQDTDQKPVHIII